MRSFVIAVLALAAVTQANVIFRELDLEDRIVGGNEAVPNSFPYQVYILMRNARGETYQCGGSLLTTDTVLTAAHCVVDYVSFDIYLGAHNIRQYESTQQRRQAVSYTAHGSYNPNTVQNDIALLKMDSPVQLNSAVQLTVLPSRAAVGNTYVGQQATVSGWGLTSDSGSTADTLRFVAESVVTNTECNQDYGYIIASQICIRGDNRRSSCEGDSGGPLVVGAQRVQVGLVSFGRREGCEKGFDPVFTRITSYLDWISMYGGVTIN